MKFKTKERNNFLQGKYTEFETCATKCCEVHLALENENKYR